MRDNGQGVQHAGDLVASVEVLTLSLVADDDVREHESRHVEGLAR